MEERLFNTLIKKDRKLATDYVKGRISGIQLCVCEKETTILKTKAGSILRCVTDEETYNKFKNKVESIYPDLCEFDWKKEG